MCTCLNTFHKLFCTLLQQNVPHRTSASGAESAVSTKLKAHQQDDVKDKTPQGVRNQ